MGKVKMTRRKLAQFFNWRVSVTLTDGRVLVGVLMAVDRHVNLVLCNTEEYRRYKVRGKAEGKELKRMLGLIVLRGQGVLYVQPEELGKDEFVEPEKAKKAKAAAKAAAPKAAAPAPGPTPGLNPLAGMPGLAGLAGLPRPTGLPQLPPGLLAQLSAGGRGLSLPMLPGMTGMGGLPGLAGPGGMTLPGMPGGLGGLGGLQLGGLNLPLPKMPGMGGLPGMGGMGGMGGLQLPNMRPPQ